MPMDNELNTYEHNACSLAMCVKYVYELCSKGKGPSIMPVSYMQNTLELINTRGQQAKRL